MCYVSTHSSLWLDSHSIPLLDYCRNPSLRLYDITQCLYVCVCGGEDTKLVLNWGGGGSEYAPRLPACLPAWRRVWFRAKTKKRTHFALSLFVHYAQTLQNATPRCDSSLWCIAFFPLLLWFLLFTPSSHQPLSLSLSLWAASGPADSKQNSNLNVNTQQMLCFLHNVFQ